MLKVFSLKFNIRTFTNKIKNSVHKIQLKNVL